MFIIDMTQNPESKKKLVIYEEGKLVNYYYSFINYLLSFESG